MKPNRNDKLIIKETSTSTSIGREKRKPFRNDKLIIKESSTGRETIKPFRKDNPVLVVQTKRINPKPYRDEKSSILLPGEKEDPPVFDLSQKNENAVVQTKRINLKPYRDEKNSILFPGEKEAPPVFCLREEMDTPQKNPERSFSSVYTYGSDPSLIKPFRFNSVLGGWCIVGVGVLFIVLVSRLFKVLVRSIWYKKKE